MPSFTLCQASPQLQSLQTCCLHIVPHVFLQFSCSCSKRIHRFCVGREMVGSGGSREGAPNGDSAVHKDDSTFGEYMATLERRSSSGNGVRRLHSSGAACTTTLLYKCSPSCMSSMMLLIHINCCHRADSIRAFFAQQDHMQVFHFIVDCLDFMGK